MHKLWEAIIGLAGGIASILGVVWILWRPEEHRGVFIASLAVGTLLLGLFTGLRWPHNPMALPRSTPDDEIRVLRDNDEMAEEVKKIVQEAREKRTPIEKVTVIQYSCWTITGTLRHLSETEAEVELYFVNPARAASVNKNHGKRAAQGPEKVSNELLKYPIRKLERFIYDAPGSIRAVWIDKHALFVGAYQYEVVPLPVIGRALDVRGAELPMFKVPYAHKDFPILERAIRGMVENWKLEKNSNGHLTVTKYEPPARAGA